MEHKHKNKMTAAGLLVAMGIIYGDIGTSPLYVMQAIIGDNPINELTVLGGLSCIFWTLTLQTTLKYVILILRADNKGEGGIFALFALVRRHAKWLTLPAIIGGATLLADGIITPPISVSSAVEGLRMLHHADGTPFVTDTVPLVIVILSGLFLFQILGTKIVGKFFGSMSGTGSPIMWVMTHRMHHRHSDKPLDPHPPGRVGITVFGKYPKVDLIGIGPIARDNVNRYIHKYYFLILALYGLCWYLAGIELFYYAFVFPVLGSIFASNAVNWYGHTRSIFGYRNYETKDKSANHAIAGLLVLGEGWHNNHHRYPKSYTTQQKWWEFDISGLIIKLIKI
jgi:hypothetical protein